MTIGSQGFGKLDALFNGSVNFVGVGGTLTIDPSVDPKKNFGINGFALGDVIDFANQPNLTTSAALNSAGIANPGEVDVYSGTTQVASFIFNSSVSYALEPISDNNGGNKLEVDPLASIDKPPTGYNINWNTIIKYERGIYLDP